MSDIYNLSFPSSFSCCALWVWSSSEYWNLIGMYSQLQISLQPWCSLCCHVNHQFLLFGSSLCLLIHYLHAACVSSKGFFQVEISVKVTNKLHYYKTNSDHYLKWQPFCNLLLYSFIYINLYFIGFIYWSVQCKIIRLWKYSHSVWFIALLSALSDIICWHLLLSTKRTCDQSQLNHLKTFIYVCIYYDVTVVYNLTW